MSDLTATFDLQSAFVAILSGGVLNTTVLSIMFLKAITFDRKLAIVETKIDAIREELDDVRENSRAEWSYRHQRDGSTA